MDPPSTIELHTEIISSFPKGSKVLEIACAHGRTAFIMESMDHIVTALDIDPAAIHNSRKFGLSRSSSVEFIVGDGRKLPFQSTLFDIVMMNGYMTMLTDLESRERSIEEASRVLKEGGTLYLADFLQTDDSDIYRQRYERHSKTTGEDHTFIVTDTGKDDGKELYRCHHYLESELRSLLASHFDILIARKQLFTSFHGNNVNGIIILAVKK